MNRTFAVAVVAPVFSLAVLIGASGRDAKLVVHEWGTFTSLQDEQGRTIGGINVEDEAVPDFVHELKAHLLVDPERLAPVFYQGAPRVHPDVTLRLETPVLYFHPPMGDEPIELDVEASFCGGWLTQYYPDAEPHAPGLEQGLFEFGTLGRETRGSLRWRGLVVGGGDEGIGPRTVAPVWLAPRRVVAAPVRSPNGESERFVFYRGVGSADAPLIVRRDETGQWLEIAARGDAPAASRALRIAAAWLVDVAEGGDGTAYRELGPFELERGGRRHCGDGSRLLGRRLFAAPSRARPDIDARSPGGGRPVR